jgi:hypothetical protein
LRQSIQRTRRSIRDTNARRKQVPVSEDDRDALLEGNLMRTHALLPRNWRQFVATAISSCLVCAALQAQSAEVHVRTSQIGYRTGDVKLAVVLSTQQPEGKCQIVNTRNAAVVFECQVRHNAGTRWGEFAWCGDVDFTAVREPGRYRIRVGDGPSPEFDIDDAVYRALPAQLLEFMTQQRCGHNPWLGAECHQQDGRTAYGPEPAGTVLDARGGWHDAADLLKYLLTSSNATGQLLLAAQIQAAADDPTTDTPARARGSRPAEVQGSLSAPDSRRLLDEAKWGLEWMLKLHPAPDQLYHQVADDRDHAGWRLPPDDQVDYGWGKGAARVVYYADGRPQGLKDYQSQSTGVANLAGRYAAAMALAFQIWQQDTTNRKFAARCLQAGREVYELGKSREGVQQGNSYGAPYRYEETTWADDMEWGAAELYRATNEERYLQDARRYAELSGATSWMNQNEIRHYQYYPFFNVGHFRLHGLVDDRVRAELAGYYRAGILSCVTRARAHPFGIGVPFIWCSNNLVVALATQCLCYERMTGDQQFQAFAARQRDWLAGCNPWGYSMFTGIGTTFPRDVHLMTTRLTQRPVRGGLVDGPVMRDIFRGLRGVSIREPDPLAAFQDERAVYHDDIGDYSTNEPTMDGTASAILLWALSR